jgi:5-hydroxyisourate hydrolase
MTTISTHVLDSVLGKPAEGLGVSLSDPNNYVHRDATNGDGRATFEGADFVPGVYTLTFQTGHWMQLLSRKTFFPQIALTFELEPGDHYHLAVLYGPYSYTAYRGS